MSTPRPVPGQVLLSSDEFVGLIDGLKNLIPERDLREQVIRTIVASTNKWRFGTPAGEIRRSDNGSIAVRVQDADAALCWEVPRLEDGDEATSEAIARWQVIHTEVWYGRAVDTDYSTTA